MTQEFLSHGDDATNLFLSHSDAAAMVMLLRRRHLDPGGSLHRGHPPGKPPRQCTKEGLTTSCAARDRCNSGTVGRKIL